MNRIAAKRYLCGGCEGTRISGGYFNAECKGEAKGCQRITDFLKGYDVCNNENNSHSTLSSMNEEFRYGEN